MSIRALVLASFVVCAPLARADFVIHTTQSGPHSIGATGAVTLPTFDSALGVLRSARVTVSGSVTGSWSVENTSAAPVAAFGDALGQYVGAIVPTSYGFPSPRPAYLDDPIVMLAPFDGVLDFTGVSAATRTFVGAMGDGEPTVTYQFQSDAALVPFVGVGATSFTFGPISLMGPTTPPSLANSVSLTVGLDVTVRYDFDPLPTKICVASSSGCPCGNQGGPGRGCGNSADAAGGTLNGGGTASLSADTFTLIGSGLTNSSALYFQGTSFGQVQSVYGDGLRCVAGNVIRLATKTNVAGASQFPLAADPSVSVRGAVGAPGTRYYQVVYRDAADYCTPSRFNSTSGYAVAWGP